MNLTVICNHNSDVKVLYNLMEASDVKVLVGIQTLSTYYSS